MLIADVIYFNVYLFDRKQKNMARFKNWVISACIVCLNVMFITTTQGSGIDVFFASPKICKKECSDKNVELSSACSKGCRLASISEWIVEPGNSTQLTQECFTACSEAYTKPDILDACHKGCQIFQTASKESLQAGPGNSLIEDNLNGMFGSNNGFFDYADSMMNDFVNSALQSLSMFQSFMPDTVGTEIIEISDGTHHEIFVIQHNQPEINTEHPNKKLIINTESGKPKSTEKENIETNLQTNANRPGAFGEFSLYRRNDESAPVDTGFDRYWQKFHKNWWTCFTKKQGLPELVFTLFWISTFVLLMLGCCIQFGQKPQLSVNGDLAFIRDSEGKLPTYLKSYPVPDGVEVSPYFYASVIDCKDKKPLLSTIEQY
uniref:Uncharacterized protein LOC100181469 n=1 Tax=Phallusia mammillata TaxID=59560 RepID=A0A6F9DI66_9ASCI|nr:uncharacterized protein LOC100181469 [Phallusia mammillata]